MNNRHISAPILLATAFSLVVASSLTSPAEPGVPSENTNIAPAAATDVPATPPTQVTPPPAAATTPTAPAAPAAVTDMTAPRPSTYTVGTGDSIWIIAQKFYCWVTSLKKLNNLTKNNLKPGQVLKIPPLKTKKPATTPSTPAPKPTTSITPKTSTSSHHKDKTYAHAQPVQDFDIPASTFASCPVPQPSPENDPEPVAPVAKKTSKEKTPAPIAELVSPAELMADEESTPAPAAPKSTNKVTLTPQTKDTFATTFPASTPKADSNNSTMPTNSTLSFASTSSKQSPRGLTLNSTSNSPFAASSNDWSTRFLQQAHALADQGLSYDESWRPPGESSSWAMDCSNTSRYLYKATAGIQLPRTASDQYYYLHLQNKAWDISPDTSAVAECTMLRESLKPGDLLFWENTYRPERQPPITHVMVYLGLNEKGQWIMAGSQTSRGGEHNRHNGGPDIYVFDPTKPCGGYTTWMGFVHHPGRFCAYGRPLDADPTKLSVAAND